VAAIRFFDAVQNARLVAAAERYYRLMYYGSVESWNLRDQHMFDTLERLLEFHGPASKAIVWEHNSHVGDASSHRNGRPGRAQRGTVSRAGSQTRRSSSVSAPIMGRSLQLRLGRSDGIKRIRPRIRPATKRLFHDSSHEAFCCILGRHQAGHTRMN